MINKLLKICIGLFFILLPLFFILIAIKEVINKKLHLVRTPIDILFIILPVVYTLSSMLFAPNKIVSFTSPLGTGTIIAISLLYFSLSQMKADHELHESLTKNFYLFTFSGSIAAAIYTLGQFKIIPFFTPIG